MTSRSEILIAGIQKLGHPFEKKVLKNIFYTSSQTANDEAFIQSSESGQYKPTNKRHSHEYIQNFISLRCTQKLSIDGKKLVKCTECRCTFILGRQLKLVQYIATIPRQCKSVFNSPSDVW